MKPNTRGEQPQHTVFPTMPNVALSAKEVEQFKVGARRMVYYIRDDGRMLLAEDGYADSPHPSLVSQVEKGANLILALRDYIKYLHEADTASSGFLYAHNWTHHPDIIEEGKRLREVIADRQAALDAPRAILSAPLLAEVGESKNGEGEPT